MALPLNTGFLHNRLKSFATKSGRADGPCDYLPTTVTLKTP